MKLLATCTQGQRARALLELAPKAEVEAVSGLGRPQGLSFRGRKGFVPHRGATPGPRAGASSLGEKRGAGRSLHSLVATRTARAEKGSCLREFPLPRVS